MNSLKFWLVSFISLLYLKFFEFSQWIDYGNDFQITALIVTLLVVIIGGIDFRTKGTLLILLYAAGLAMSITMVTVFRDQSFLTSVFALKSYSALFFYFALRALKIREGELVRLILFLGLLYMIFYRLNLSSYPELIFGQKASEARNAIRVTFAGQSFMVFGCIYSVTMLMRKLSIMPLLFVFFALETLLLRAGRNSLVAIALVLIWLVLFQMNMSRRKLYVFVAFSILLFFNLNSASTIIDGLLDASISDAQLGSSYIRFASYRYYLLEHPVHWLNILFGNGFHTANSSWGQAVINDLWFSKGYYAEDIGLIGFWSYFGIATLVAYLSILRYFFQRRSGRDVRGYTLYLIFMSTATNASYTIDALILLPMLLYLVELRHEEGVLC